MNAHTARVRPSAARLAGALLALSLLASGCGESASEPDGTAPSAATSDGSATSDGGTSDGGGASDAGGASDGDGKTAASIPQDPYPVSPAPEGFEAPDPCSGEGAYFTEVGQPATPDLPERAGESLTIELTGIEGEDAQLTAMIGDSTPRPIENITIGETVTLDLWTISVTSVCGDTEQVQFDLID